MKFSKKILPVLALALIASTALANPGWRRPGHGPGHGGPGHGNPGHGGPGWNPGHPGHGGPGHGGPGWNPGHPGHPHHPPHNGGGCSPEVAASNLDVAEKALNATAQRADFASAAKLKQALADIQANQDKTQRIQAYMAIVGVDSMDQAADLMGGENLDQYAEIARANMDLSQEQAQIMVDALTTALRGTLD